MAKGASKQSRVLMVLYYYHPYVSGLSIMAKRVAEGLAKSGHKVTILTSQYDRKLPLFESINGVNVVRRPVLFRLNKGVIMPTFWLDIVRYARRNDYVNAFLPLADSGLASLFIPRRKLVTTYICDIYLGAKLIDRLITLITKLFMHIQLMRSKIVLPLSIDYLEHSPMRRYLAKSAPAYPPITTEEFFPVDAVPLFKRLKVKKSTIKIGFVGRVVYEKGIDYLLESIPYLRKRLKDFKVIIVGDYEKVAGGSTKDQLDKYVKLYPENIMFTGYLGDDDRNRFYSGIDVLVLPSIDPLEAFGMVQVEAMLCGAPVVASNLPGVREVVQKSGYGRISKVRNPRDIAAQIVEVVMHKRRYKPIRQEVLKHFGPDTTIATYSEAMPKIP